MELGGKRRAVYISPVNLGPRFFLRPLAGKYPSHQPLNSELRWASSFETFRKTTTLD
jgi:hypothetical protein